MMEQLDWREHELGTAGGGAGAVLGELRGVVRKEVATVPVLTRPRGGSLRRPVLGRARAVQPAVHGVRYCDVFRKGCWFNMQ